MGYLGKPSSCILFLLVGVKIPVRFFYSETESAFKSLSMQMLSNSAPQKKNTPNEYNPKNQNYGIKPVRMH